MASRKCWSSWLSIILRDRHCCLRNIPVVNHQRSRQCMIQAKNVVQHRHCSSDTNSSLPDNSKPYYNYEISKDPEEWRYVERLLPSEMIPEPPDVTGTTPSGWVPPKDDLIKDLPYMVERTKNHMLPVYIDETRSNARKFTLVKNIKGDIWALETELREHLESVVNEYTGQVLTQVSEPGRWLRVRGEYSRQVAKFLVDKGF